MVEWRAAGRGEAGGGAERVPQQLRVFVLGGGSFLSLLFFLFLYYQVLFAVHPSAACCMQVLPNPSATTVRGARAQSLPIYLASLTLSGLPFPIPSLTGTLFVLAVLSQVLYIDGFSTHIPWSVRVLCLTSRLFLKSFSHRASVVPGLLTSVFLLAGTDGPYTFSPAPTVFYA